MSNPFFQFKQFTIRHDKCAMKVGTDGVLLGAWAGTESCSRILDVGTGTGLIALMLAQRSKAVVDAIDIDADACLQAQENADSSLFAGRINVFHSDLADFAQASTHLYGLIVSNPPYISRDDVEEVGANVLASEPHLALFADRDGYAIYEKIAQQAPSVLTPDGKIYLEIGYKQGAKVKELFREAFPDKRVRVLKDQFGQERMVVVDNG